MAGVGNSGGAIYWRTEIVVVSENRFAGVQADSNSDTFNVNPEGVLFGLVCKCSLDLTCTPNAINRTLERHHKCIANGFDFVTVVSGDGFADDPVVYLERF